LVPAFQAASSVKEVPVNVPAPATPKKRRVSIKANKDILFGPLTRQEKLFAAVLSDMLMESTNDTSYSSAFPEDGDSPAGDISTGSEGFSFQEVVLTPIVKKGSPMKVKKIKYSPGKENISPVCRASSPILSQIDCSVFRSPQGSKRKSPPAVPTSPVRTSTYLTSTAKGSPQSRIGRPLTNPLLDQGALPLPPSLRSSISRSTAPRLVSPAKHRFNLFYSSKVGNPGRPSPLSFFSA
jgi:hypothetical protein